MSMNGMCEGAPPVLKESEIKDLCEKFVKPDDDDDVPFFFEVQIKLLFCQIKG